MLLLGPKCFLGSDECLKRSNQMADGIFVSLVILVRSLILQEILVLHLAALNNGYQL